MTSVPDSVATASTDIVALTRDNNAEERNYQREDFPAGENAFVWQHPQS